MSARAGYPIEVHESFHFDNPEAFKRAGKTFDMSEASEHYWEVSGTKLIPACGHKHATEEEAREQCYEAQKKAYIMKRWPKMGLRLYPEASATVDVNKV